MLRSALVLLLLLPLLTGAATDAHVPSLGEHPLAGMGHGLRPEAAGLPAGQIGSKLLELTAAPDVQRAGPRRTPHGRALTGAAAGRGAVSRILASCADRARLGYAATLASSRRSEPSTLGKPPPSSRS
ncbi:hypothetical protein BH23GEM9_BH23GEM9_00960 [soil metagenome]